MANTKRTKRKLGFYYLSINRDSGLVEIFKNTINHIRLKNKDDRKYDLGNNRFCFLDYCDIRNGEERYCLIIKSAKYNHIPKLIHKDTLEERNNPKQKEEGEVEKTHIVIKVLDNSICLISDRHQGGVTITQLISYLNKFIQHDDGNDAKFNYEKVLNEDFLNEIDNLERVIQADLIVDRMLLGSEALNFSERTEHIKQYMTLTVKAEPKHSIIDAVKEWFRKIGGVNSKIYRIRIKGKNEDNNQVVLNTDGIEKQEYIEVNVDEETGEVQSIELLEQINQILNTFD